MNFKHHIPLDFVYSGKMMFGVNDLIEKNYFPKDAHILCIHTGGLQGNSSFKTLLAFETPSDLE
jgi:1-aminocyclopropane-1-carboxylate deaminase